MLVSDAMRPYMGRRPVVLVLMLVSDAMRPYMRRRPVVLFPMLLLQAVLLSTWMSSIVSPRWS
jgi:hypothetical protein